MNKNKPVVPGAVEFEPEFVAGLKKMFEEQIQFNRVLGLKITSLRPERVTGRIDMKPDLIGHFAYQRLHGGVISAGLDAMAGLAVMAAIGARHMDEPPLPRLHRFAKLGTIDLRIDYLRQAIGSHFELSARGDAPGLARGLDAHGVPRRRRRAAVDRLGRLHRFVALKKVARDFFQRLACVRRPGKPDPSHRRNRAACYCARFAQRAARASVAGSRRPCR